MIPLAQQSLVEFSGEYWMLKYGIIVKTYNEGEQIKLIVEMTKSHKGYMQFRLCVNNDKKKDKDQSCFDQ